MVNFRFKAEKYFSDQSTEHLTRCKLNYERLIQDDAKRAIYMLSRVICNKKSIRVIFEDGVPNLFDFIRDENFVEDEG